MRPVQVSPGSPAAEAGLEVRHKVWGLATRGTGSLQRRLQQVCRNSPAMTMLLMVD